MSFGEFVRDILKKGLGGYFLYKLIGCRGMVFLRRILVNFSRRNDKVVDNF